MAFETSNIIITVGIYFLFVLYVIGIIHIKKSSALKKLNAFDYEKFLPSDEIHYLKQIFLLIMASFFIFGLISLFFIYDYYVDISLFDIILVIIAIGYIADNDYKSIIMSLLLMPAPVVLWFLNISITPLLIIHWIGICIGTIYFIHQFLKFTEKNNLGFTVIIFVLILMVSCFITSYYEKTNLLDSLVMISNAFTSNGYTILGHSTISKMDSILLVWGGYLLSGVGTATLTAAILIKYLKSRIESQDKKIDALTNEIKELNKLMKK